MGNHDPYSDCAIPFCRWTENASLEEGSQWTEPEIFRWRGNTIKTQDFDQRLSDAGHSNVIGYRQPSTVRSSEKTRR